MGYSAFDNHSKPAWNLGRKIGSKRALKQKEVWAIRFWLEQEGRMRDRALFDLATDSKLRGCDLVRIRIAELVSGTAIRDRALVVQRKTGRPVQFEILEPARTTLRHGSTAGADRSMTTPSQAAAIIPPTSAPASTADSSMSGFGHRAEGAEPRDPFTASHESVENLQADRQPESRSNPAWSYQDREHGALPRRRR